MRRLGFSTVILALGLILANHAFARINAPPRSTADKEEKTDGRQPQRSLTLDGSTVHNVGELQMHVANWGMFGSLPGIGQPYSEAPSAQWPAGSGNEYLFGAGLWVGALKNGLPAVSTALLDIFEFLPSPSPIDVMYTASSGANGGTRLPSPVADDDGDGVVDEDWLNGRDDDGDGMIDEDFAAVSNQMFSCWYTDDQPTSIQIHPEHNPLNIVVRQESYQWEEDRFDDFVGINYWITNAGTNLLEDVYIGFFADCDAGNREIENYWQDDATGFHREPALCIDVPVSIDVAFTYDLDGDGGQTPGYFGVMFLGHTTDPTGEVAPRRVGISTYANFSGEGSFEEGGDPEDDMERYTLLSSQRIERDAQVPRDYRMLISGGPFKELLPQQTLVFQTAFVIGAGLTGMENNAGSAMLTYSGAWFNLDLDPLTGIAGRETPVPGPADGVVVDSCQDGLNVPINWNKREPIWINNDCAREEFVRIACGLTREDSVAYMTGIGGNESQINWIVGTAPPPPHLRLDTSARDGVVIYWDNFSETVPDVKTQKMDFEGYRVWRADNWDRPLGTSVRNGPAHDLWKMLFKTDLVNNLGEDSGMDRYRYEPLKHRLTAREKADMIEMIRAHLTEYPNSSAPCPPGVSTEECETLQALAAWELALPEGRQYYRYVDRAVHRGRPYFYSVTADDHNVDAVTGRLSAGKEGDPSSNFVFTEPSTAAQPAHNYAAEKVYVVPNPATEESMAAWRLNPNNDDPTGVKVEFRNLPADQGTIRIYTLAGDLVENIPFDGRAGAGTVKWDLVSRNGQDITSGVYLFSVEPESDRFGRRIGKFVVIR